MSFDNTTSDAFPPNVRRASVGDWAERIPVMHVAKAMTKHTGTVRRFSPRIFRRGYISFSNEQKLQLFSYPLYKTKADKFPKILRD
jgi:hypothetical protein